MAPNEWRKVQAAPMFRQEKQDRTVKARVVCSGKPMRKRTSREDPSSPAAALKSIILAGGIEAHEERNVVTCNAPDAFARALMRETKSRDEQAMMEITGALLNVSLRSN